MRDPPTFDILLSFSQFVESLVIHDELVFEDSCDPAVTEYVKYIEDSSLRNYVPCLRPHLNEFEHEDVIVKSVRGALEELLLVDNIPL